MIKQHLFLIVFMCCAFSSKTQTKNYNNDLLECLSISNQNNNIIIYDADHDDTAIQNAISSSIQKISNNHVCNLYLETNDFESLLFTNAILDLEKNESLLRVCFVNFFGFSPKWSFFDYLTKSIASKKINLIGIDCDNPIKPCWLIIIDSTKQEFKKRNISLKVFDSIDNIVNIAPGLNSNLSCITKTEYQRAEKGFNFIIENLSDNFLKTAWINVLNFLHWCSLRGVLDYNKIQQCADVPRWFAYRDSIMAKNFLAVSDPNSIMHILSVGASHCQRKGLVYKNITSDSIPYSMTDYLYNTVNDYKRILVTTKKNTNILSEKKYLTIKNVQPNIKVISLKRNEDKNSIFFDLNIYCRKNIEANWFNSFDYVILLN